MSRVSRETGVPVTALRYHNVYGPRMPRDTPYAGVASIFASALAAGEAPRVFEDGQQLRDFVHVRDVARANVLALTARPGQSPGALNICSGKPRTVGEMAAALCRCRPDPRAGARRNRPVPPRRRAARLRERRAGRGRARVRRRGGVRRRDGRVRQSTVAPRHRLTWRGNARKSAGVSRSALTP